MAKDGKGGALDETGQLASRFTSPEEEEALALETLGTAGIAGMGPQVWRGFPLYIERRFLAALFCALFVRCCAVMGCDGM